MKNLKEPSAYIPNSTEAVIVELERVRDEIASLKKSEENLKERLTAQFDLSAAYKEKGEPFGVVNFINGEYKVSFTTPKKVEWDQVGLKELAQLGAPVSVEYGLSETLFKALDKDGQDAFMPYRTVKPGSISIKVEAV